MRCVMERGECSVVIDVGTAEDSRCTRAGSEATVATNRSRETCTVCIQSASDSSAGLELASKIGTTFSEDWRGSGVWSQWYGCNGETKRSESFDCRVDYITG